jgi:hypothetical protein
MASDELMAFLQAVSHLALSPAERAVALLWWHGLTDAAAARSVRELVREIEGAGFGQQNVTRLAGSLGRDARTTKSRDGRYAIRATARRTLDETYLPLLKVRPTPRSNSVLPLELVGDTRQYIERVVLQLNVSYENGSFDCCAVMCRRLLETLIIEAYEAANRAEELKGNDGHFMMFSGLLNKLEKDKAFSLGRNSLQGLRDFKALGDLSAHNRRFNARADDIDRIRPGLRVATEELLTLAGLSK